MKELEIKVGYYIRTEYGEIAKVININYDNTYNKGGLIVLDNYTKYTQYIDKNNIKNISKDIIDLIEVGDLVNGNVILKIEDIKNSDEKIFTLYDTGLKRHCEMWCNEDIKTIITHEQLKQIEYRVEG